MQRRSRWRRRVRMQQVSTAQFFDVGGEDNGARISAESRKDSESANPGIEVGHHSRSTNSELARRREPPADRLNQCVGQLLIRVWIVAPAHQHR